jgi:hypothetical protein
MEKEEKRKEFVIKIGPLLKKIIEIQKDIIKETTWDCVKPSDYEAGEIIAKKITESKLL